MILSLKICFLQPCNILRLSFSFKVNIPVNKCLFIYMKTSWFGKVECWHSSLLSARLKS